LIRPRLQLPGHRGVAVVRHRVRSQCRRTWTAIRHGIAPRGQRGASGARAFLLSLLLACPPLWGAAGAAQAAPAQAPIPVIIDTDAGDDIDDAFALATALADPRLEVLGITTAWGDTRTRVLLVRRLLAALGRTDVPVAQGPATANTTPFTQRQWAERAADTSPAPDALAFIRAAVERRPGQITLIALAPLSNLAALLQGHPATVRGLRQLVMMGGSIHAGYRLGGALANSVPSAEYNVAAQPQALAALLDSGVAVKLFPLDSTQIKLDEVRRDQLFAYGSAASDAITELYHQWRLWNAWGQITPTLFDVVPVAWLLDPASCPVTPLRIGVDTAGFTRVVDGVSNVEACLAADEGAILARVMNALAPPRPMPH